MRSALVPAHGVKNEVYIEEITRPRGDTNFIFEC